MDKLSGESLIVLGIIILLLGLSPSIFDYIIIIVIIVGLLYCWQSSNLWLRAIAILGMIMIALVIFGLFSDSVIGLFFVADLIVSFSEKIDILQNLIMSIPNNVLILSGIGFIVFGFIVSKLRISFRYKWDNSIFMYRKKSDTKKYSILIVLSIVILVSIYYYNINPESFSSIVSNVTNIIPISTISRSGCPIEKELKEIISDSAKSTSEKLPTVWNINNFKIAYGKIEEIYTGEDLEKVRGYNLGSARDVSIFESNYMLNLNPTNEYHEFHCRKGKKEGENLNYLYCYTKDVLYDDLLIWKDIISSDGKIEKKIRIIVSQLTLDFQTFEIIQLKCEEISVS